MKKTLLIALLTASAIALSTGAAFAAGVTLTTGQDAMKKWATGSSGPIQIADSAGGGTIEINLSPNVYLKYVPDEETTNDPKGNTFAAGSLNSNGTKQYGIASNYTGMYAYDYDEKPGTNALDFTDADSAAFTTNFYEIGK